MNIQYVFSHHSSQISPVILMKLRGIYLLHAMDTYRSDKKVIKRPVVFHGHFKRPQIMKYEVVHIW